MQSRSNGGGGGHPATPPPRQLEISLNFRDIFILFKGAAPQIPVLKYTLAFV